MEDNKQNTVVPASQSGSGVGSGIKLICRNQYCFGRPIKERRNELKISQEELGKMVGVSTTTIQNWEAGTWPNGKYIVTLAKVLKCSLDYLLTDKETVPDAEKQIDRPVPLYNKVEAPVAGVGDRMVEYSAGVNLKDKLIEAQEKLISRLEKEIIDLKAQLEAKYATNNMS